MGKVKLLIADRNTEDIKLISKILEKDKYLIFTTTSASRIKSEAESKKINMLIMDPSFSDKNAYEICKKLRKKFNNTPFQIVLTSVPSEEYNVYRAIDAGADDFICKPIDPPEFYARIKAAEIRLQKQHNLLSEREYYKQAFEQKEELTSRILNENIRLKEAYKNIEALNKELEKVARYDYLSGILNRMALFSVIEMEIERATRAKTPLAGIMADIDNFKRINDDYGHQVGDEVIREIGVILRRTLRKYDHAGRYGGEEFFLVLPDTDVEQARRIAERFRNELKDLKIETERENLRITISMGITKYRLGEKRETWIARADRAMYMAKEAGRDKIFIE